MSEANRENRRGNSLPTAAAVAINGAALVAFVATLLFLANVTFPTTGTCHLLSYIGAGGAPFLDFPDTDDLGEGSWTSIDAVTFEEGKPTSQTRFEQAILSPCAISVMNSDGSKGYFLATDDARGGIYRVSSDDVQPLRRTSDNYDEDDLVSSAHTVVTGNDRLSTLYLYSGDADDPNVDAWVVEVEYGGAKEPGYPVRMTGELYLAGSDSPTALTRAFDEFDGSKFTHAVDTDGNGAIVRSLERTYEDGRTVTTMFDSEGSVVSMQETSYDFLGRVTERTTYDADGTLLNQMTFHYRIWEKFAILPGIGFALIFLGISLTVALELRITLKRLTIKRISNKEAAA